ncbi:hypothetical protein DITRI_Ditri14bG0058800 [Diplodiscus trichospermus]
MALPNQVLEVVDPLLLVGDNQEQTASRSINPRRAQKKKARMKDCLISILSVGIACSVGSPIDRMDIVDATKELHFIKDKYIEAKTWTQRSEQP